MIPSPYFITIKNGLEIQFKDYSDNTPTSWDWNFGDGSINGNTKDVTHTYSDPGFYTVTLTVTNTDGSDSIILTISASSGDIVNPLDQRIWFLINAYIPDSILNIITPDEKQALISKWQLYLFPLVLVDTPIPEAELHNELLYPPLVNQLVAELVAYNLIIQGANQFMIQLGSEGSNASSTTTTTQQKKKIETGPTVVEWYQDKTSEELGELGSAFAAAVKPGGTIDMIKEQICQLSKRLRIYLPMCGQLSHSPTIPSKINPESVVQAGNPFGIPKKYL